MCGIVGYIGRKEATPILLEGLKRLEYRGYDSAGVTMLTDVLTLETKKCKGRLRNLEERLDKEPLCGNIGIGHTRWATHGEPTDLNSHPHANDKETISVVHNGIVENFMELKEKLVRKGFHFATETDTEVIPNLIDYYYEGDLLAAFMKAISRMNGSYAVGAVSVHEPGKIIAMRKDSPLICGVSEDGAYLASDVPAILKYTRDIYYLDDNEFAVLTKDGIRFYEQDGEEIQKELHHITWDIDSAEKDGYPHFMIKEIHEQPKAIRDTMASRIVKGKPVSLDGIQISGEDLKNIDKIMIVACGTAYHAGVVGKYVIEEMTRIPVEVDIASEFRYRNPIVSEHTLMIVISQSGETADTLAAMREGKKRGAKILAITNVVGSTITRETENVIYTWAGPEISVASTKAYSTQLVCLYAVALFLAQERQSLPIEAIEAVKEELFLLPEKAEQVLEHKEAIQKFASMHYNHPSIFYLGRGMDYAVAMEGSLKLKEISYIHSESYAGGELKHGTIALIEKGTVVISLVTQKRIAEKMISNIKEVTTRGAKVLCIAVDGVPSIEKSVDEVLCLPDTHPVLTPVLAVIPLQLLAYYMAAQRGCDVDKPRNLAKSVTVE